MRMSLLTRLPIEDEHEHRDRRRAMRQVDAVQAAEDALDRWQPGGEDKRQWERDRGGEAGHGSEAGKREREGGEA
ncbi:MAG: hypothetical protein M3T56_01960 [Chloroflexota bacterium]|nr:hypothetical protein [Chloroflexota bacterium]